jgi:hypothetical protein
VQATTGSNICVCIYIPLKYIIIIAVTTTVILESKREAVSMNAKEGYAGVEV